MKRFSFLLATMAILGAGCINSTSPATVPEEPPAPPAQIGYVGCTPKALTVLEPAAGQRASLPLTVKVRVQNESQPDCHWTVFEAQAGTMRLLDADGVTVGAGTLTTTEDWMTDGPVEFTGEIPALALITGPATLVISEENPSDQGIVQEVSIPLIMQ